MITKRRRQQTYGEFLSINAGSLQTVDKPIAEAYRPVDRSCTLARPDVSHIDAALDNALAEQRIVGMVVLVGHGHKLIYRRAAGYADRELAKPMRYDTLFRLASLTKPIVTAAAMALVGQGWLDLDDPVSKWLHTFRPRAPTAAEARMTVRHLLTHTAGLSYGFLEPATGAYRHAGISDGLAEPGLGMPEQLRRLSGVPLSYVPGTGWRYSLATDVLGAILARVVAAPLPEAVRELVTGPLRLTDTDFLVREQARLAAPYVDGAPPRRMSDPDVVHFGDGAGIRFSPSRIFNDSSFASAGAGMAGTAVDFFNFLEALHRGGGPILTPECVRAMMTNQVGSLRVDLEPTPAWGFGFGGAVLVDRELAKVPQAPGTWKWGGVYGHHWYVDPINRLTVVFLSNTAIEGMVGKVVTEVRTAIYGLAS